MINKHGVDVSKIQVGDVVEVSESCTLEQVTFIFLDGDIQVDSSWSTPPNDITEHYARQPREERG